MLITKEILLKNGFVAMSEESWCGNGYDYRVPPEKGGSRTTLTDYVLYNVVGDDDFIVRFKKFELNSGCDESILFLCTEWHPKCSDGEMICFDSSTVEMLEIAHFFATGKKLKIEI